MSEHLSEHRHDPTSDPACAMAHGDLPPAEDGRVLVAVFASPVARDLLHFGRHLGYRTVLLEPEPSAATGRAQGTADAADTVASSVSPDLFGGQADVVVTDHDRPELGDVLAAVLAEQTRWVGVMGSPRHTAPHVPALRERGVAEADVARVHRPIGLNIGSHSPAEIAVATLAGLLADRNGRPGGFAHSPPAEAVRA